MMMFRSWICELMAPEGGGSPGGGAAAAPAASPSPAPAAAPTATPISGGGTHVVDDTGDVGAAGASADDGFGGFNFDEVELASPEEPLVEATTTPVAPTAPVATPAPVAPVAPAPVAQPQPARGEATEFTLDNIQQHFADAKDAMTQHLAKTLFTLTSEESEALIASPETVLPQLLARTLYHALSSIPAQIKQFVPGLIASQTAKATNEAAHETQFFTAWPGLRGQDQAVVHALQAVMAMKPDASVEDAIRIGGHMACVALGLDPGTVGSNGGVAPAGAGAKKAKVGGSAAPFRPAGAATTLPGSNGATPSAVVSANADPWAGFDLPNSD